MLQLLLTLVGCCWLLVVSAAEEKPGFEGIAPDPYPGARLSDSEVAGETVFYDFILSPVEKIRRDLSIERFVRSSGTLARQTWEIPSGVTLEEVEGYYQRTLGQLLSTSPVFECRARDCGRSNLWANEIFHSATLYGSDQNQYYSAWVSRQGDQQLLIALYIVQRGNRRVYAHLDLFQPLEPVALDVDSILLRELTRQGFAEVHDVQPDSAGNLAGSELNRLERLARELILFRGETAYVVCHLYGSRDTESLIRMSQHCAEAALERLKTEAGPDLKAFGAGPLLPRSGRTHARLELVFPDRLNEG